MRLAADANVLLSAVIGGQANRVLSHPEVNAMTTGQTIAEVQEYAAVLARKKNLALDLILLEDLPFLHRRSPPAYRTA